MDDIWLDQGFWNRFLGRFRWWRRRSGGHWDMTSSGWARVDWYFPREEFYDGRCPRTGMAHPRCDNYVSPQALPEAKLVL